MKIKAIILIISVFISQQMNANIKVVTSLSDLADLTKAVGGDKVTVDYIVRGSQNPHFIEVKPSYMLKLKSADLFIIIGMQLEMWAPQIIDGSRNTNLTVVDCSQNIKKLEVPATKVDASYGDVHPFGNPHYWLDPSNVKIILNEITLALTKVSPSDEEYFKSNMNSYLNVLDKKISEWDQLLLPYKGSKFVSYHTSFSYFANHFGLIVAGYVEPKPGIAPSPTHSAELMDLMRKSKIKVIGLEQFYEDNVPTQIANAVGGKVVKLATSTGAYDGIDTYIDMIDYNVHQLVNAFKNY